MDIEHLKITDKIHLLIFDTQYEIASTFIRFQEHYESPKFRGKIFSLNEFKRWYIKNSPNGKKTGRFTYYSDWDGFNIPSYILKPFLKGRFDKLSSKENKILKIFKDLKEPYYIIAVHRKIPQLASLLKHEMAHGLFYTEKVYKREVLNVLKKFNLSEIKRRVKYNSAGYHEAVLNDEIHAYLIASGKRVKLNNHKTMQRMLDNIYNQYLKLKSANMPSLSNLRN